MSLFPDELQSETKVCTCCKIEKPLSEFHKNGTYRKNPSNVPERMKRRGECKVCRGVNGKRPSDASGTLRKKLGISRPPEGTPCECCGKTHRKLCFDHCHVTGKFRGWICGTCNSTLGKYGDNLEGIIKLVEYLVKSEPSDNMIKIMKLVEYIKK
tara:strand:+ start:5163 stop:5627 length:465 start_codon:yes stop_codon:yes gene_type:complete